MADYAIPKVNTAYIMYIGLIDQSNTKLLKAAPTLASGDFTSSLDGAAFANLATLPTVTPAAGRGVKCSFSAGEMNGDNIFFAAVDAAGAEWCDQAINIQTSARGIADLAYPATSGRSMVVDAAGLIDANMVKAGPTGSGTAQTARDLGLALPAVAPQAAGGLITSAAGSFDIDEMNVDVEAIQTLVTTALPNAAPQAAGGLITSIAGSLDLDEMNVDVEAIQAKTDSLTFTVANQIDANVKDWAGVAVTALKTFPLLKNTALTAFEFNMVLATDHISPATGKTVTVQVSIDGAAYVNATNTPATEVALGTYKINLAAADLNGSIITLRATASGCDPTIIPLVLAG